MLKFLVRAYKAQNNEVKYIIIGILIITLWIISGSVFPSHKPDVKNKRSGVSYKTLQSVAVPKHMILRVGGVVESKKIVQLVCESSGKVEEINAHKGAFLKRGEVILKVDVKNKKELYEKAKSKLQQSEIELSSATNLYNKKLGSDADFAKAKYQLNSASADFRQAELDLHDAQVLAPFDGYVDDIKVHDGEYLFGANGPKNSVIGTFIAAEPTVIRSEIADGKVQFVQQGQRVLIKTISGIEYPGSVLSIAKSANKATNSFPIEIAVDNKEFGLLNGQIVFVQIFMQKRNAHKIPQSVLTLDANNDLGIKAVRDGTVYFYKVDIIDEEPGYIWAAGLPANINMIVRGHTYLSVGESLDMDNRVSLEQ